jgi:hypothetical protein
LRWAKSQGATCGAAHSGFGLATRDASLPNYDVPAFDGIGANEFIVDVTHDVPGPDRKPVPAVDFLSTVRQPADLGIEHVVPRPQCGLPAAHRRRVGFSVHLR